MADDTKNGTLQSNLSLGNNMVKASPVGANIMEATVEVAAAASAGSVYTMFRVPSNARIHGLSEVAFDDLASVGVPTIDFGFAAVEGNITSDPDALNNGIDVATAAGTAKLIADAANYGKQAWTFVNGQATDPGGFFDLTISLVDAAANTGGTITATLVYSID